MGKSWGKGKSGRGKHAGRGGDAGDGAADEDAFRAARNSGQASTVGMLPPSDSDSDSGSESGGEARPAAPRGAVGELPPSSSSSDGSGSSSSSGSGSDSDARPKPKAAGRRVSFADDAGAPAPRRAAAPPPAAAAEPPRRRRGDDDGPDPETVARDLARLRLAREKREAERLARIAAEGYDRYAPPTGANARPLPAGHPGAGAAGGGGGGGGGGGDAAAGKS